MQSFDPTLLSQQDIAADQLPNTIRNEEVAFVYLSEIKDPLFQRNWGG